MGQLTRECWRDLRAVLLLVRVPDLLKGRLTATFLSLWRDALLPPTGSLSLSPSSPPPRAGWRRSPGSGGSVVQDGQPGGCEVEPAFYSSPSLQPALLHSAMGLR